VRAVLTRPELGYGQAVDAVKSAARVKRYIVMYTCRSGADSSVAWRGDAHDRDSPVLAHLLHNRLKTASRFSALHAGRALLLRKVPSNWVDSGDFLWLEGLRKSKIPIFSLGFLAP
jgi:hypothetical protein